MDYLGIILEGYFHPTQIRHLEGHFYREFKKAQREFFEPQEFFDGLLSVLEEIRHTVSIQRNSNPEIRKLKKLKKILLKREKNNEEIIDLINKRLNTLISSGYNIKLPPTLEPLNPLMERTSVPRKFRNRKISEHGVDWILFHIETAKRKIYNEMGIDGYSKVTDPEVSLSDFFDLEKIDLAKVGEIQKAYKDKSGKEAAALIHLLINRYQFVEITKDDKKGNSLKDFFKMFGFKGTYQGASKHLYGLEWNHPADDDVLQYADKTLKEIIKEN